MADPSNVNAMFAAFNAMFAALSAMFATFDVLLHSHSSDQGIEALALAFAPDGSSVNQALELLLTNEAALNEVCGRVLLGCLLLRKIPCGLLHHKQVSHLNLCRPPVLNRAP